VPGYRRPVTAADRRRQAEQREAKLAALQERLQTEVAALRSGRDWTRWLDVARRFHTYSTGAVGYSRSVNA
jgi:hypothetical protein